MVKVLIDSSAERVGDSPGTHSFDATFDARGFEDLSAGDEVGT